MQITLVDHDLRSFSPNAWNSPISDPDPGPRTPDSTNHHLETMAAATIRQPTTTKHHHHHDGCVDERTRCWSHRLCHHLWWNHRSRPHTSVRTSERWHGRAIHLRPEGQGPWRPSKLDKPQNNQSDCGRDIRVWRRMGTTQQSADGMDNSTKNKQQIHSSRAIIAATITRK